MLMARGSRRSDWDPTPLKAGASPSLLSGLEPADEIKIQLN